MKHQANEPRVTWAWAPRYAGETGAEYAARLAEMRASLAPPEVSLHGGARSEIPPTVKITC